MESKKNKIKYSFFNSRVFRMKKIFYGILVNFFLTFITFFVASFLLDINVLETFNYLFVCFLIIFFTRQILSFTFFDDYKVSWSKASLYTAYIKFFNNTISLIIYFSIFILLDFKNSLNILFVKL